MNTSIPNACWCQTTEEHMAGWVLLQFTYSCVLHFTYASVLSNTQPYKLTHVHTYMRAHTHTHAHRYKHTHTHIDTNTDTLSQQQFRHSWTDVFQLESELEYFSDLFKRVEHVIRSCPCPHITSYPLSPSKSSNTYSH